MVFILKPKITRPVKFLIFSLFCLLLLIGCFSPWKGDGMIITFQLMDDTELSDVSFPPDPEILNQLEHYIEFISVDNANKDFMVYAKGQGTINVVVMPGYWDIVITTFLNGEVYAIGIIENANIQFGQNNIFTVNMYHHGIISVPSIEVNTILAKLEWIQQNALYGMSYLIEVDGTEDDIGNFQPFNLDFDGKKIGVILVSDDTSDNPASLREIKLGSTGSMFTVAETVTLTLDKNISLIGLNSLSPNTQPLVTVSGNLIMLEGSKITKNDSTTQDTSGGVSVINGGIFTMNGGEISENSATGNGGGVGVSSSSTNKISHFYMNGGKIINNNAIKSADNPEGYNEGTGGGVHIWNSRFNMNGGEISGNTAKHGGRGVNMWSDHDHGFIEIKGGIIKENPGGRGVQVGTDADNGPTFTMSGGEITGHEDGGVIIHSGIVFNMSGSAKIHNNFTTGDFPGGGVRLEGGTFNMTGGSIYENTASEDNGGGVLVGGDATFNMSGGTIYENTANRYGDDTGLGGGVCVEGHFEMNTGAEITGNSSHWGGGVAVRESGIFTMKGGEISNGNTADYGGGVAVASDGIFNMEGGEIHSNKAEYGFVVPDLGGNGGGVHIDGGRFNMSGNAAIRNNDGGGVFIDAGTFNMSNGIISENKINGGVILTEDGTFAMTNGDITTNVFDNSYYNNGYGGGGVTIGLISTFTMNGGRIHNNKSIEEGGGVYVMGTFNMSSGEIYSNESINGGGVACGEDSEFNMFGNALIRENTAFGLGGGVTMYSGRFTMYENAKIHDNKTIFTTDREYFYGGGVRCSSDSEFIMSGNAAIFNNTTHDDGGGVHIQHNSRFEMSENARIYNNTARIGGGGVQISNEAIFEMKGGRIYGNNTTTGAGGGIRLNDNTNTIFRISNGIIYGSTETGVDEDGIPLANIASTNAALGFGATTSTPTIQRGTFNELGTFNFLGNLTNSNTTINIENGVPFP